MQMAQNSLMRKYVILNSDFLRGIALFVGATEKPIHTRRQQGRLAVVRVYRMSRISYNFRFSENAHIKCVFV